MYYPISPEDAKGREQAEVYSDRKAKAIRKTFYVKKLDKVFRTAEYFENAPHKVNETFPLILFSHGYNSFIEANTYLCCFLASQGYIVASVGHAYEAVETDYEDGSFDVFDKRINKMMYDSMLGAMVGQLRLMNKKMSPEEAAEKFDAFQKKHMSFLKTRLEEWAIDMTSALREIRRRYAEQIDFSNGIGASGHSFGGATAYYLCQNDPEISCGINIDGAVFGDYQAKTMSKPFLQICCKENYNFVTRPLLATTAPVHLAIFHNMKHLGFTDMKFYLPMKFLTGKMPADRMQENLAEIHRSLFDKYLKGMDVRLEKEIHVK